MLQSAQKDPSQAVVFCSHHYCHNGQVQQPPPKMLASVDASSPLTTCDSLEIECATKQILTSNFQQQKQKHLDFMAF